MHDVLLEKLASLDTRQRSRFHAFQERLRVSKKSNAELDHLLQLLGQVDKEIQEMTFSEDFTGAGLDTTTLLNASMGHKTPLSKSMLMRSNSSLGIHVEVWP